MNFPKVIIVVALLITSVACGKKESPDAQVRATIVRAEAAVEKKDNAALRGMVSDKYSDTRGQDKRAVDGLLRVYFLRNQSLHLLTRVSSVTLPEKDKALAVVYVGMAAQPLTSEQELERLRADLYRFELTFAKEGNDWRVLQAEWRPAELADFVHR